MSKTEYGDIRATNKPYFSVLLGNHGHQFCFGLDFFGFGASAIHARNIMELFKLELYPVIDRRNQLVLIGVALLVLNVR